MPTILVLDDNAEDVELIRRITVEGDYTILVAQNLEDFRLQLEQQPIDLAIISLATVSEADTPLLQHVLRQAPDTRVLALAPPRRGDGLATLLRAESLHAHRLLAKPIDPEQLLTLLNLTFPQPTRQD